MMSLLESLLGHPALYIAAQRAVGADLARREAIAALQLGPRDRILDIGCGPAYYVSELECSSYYGFDSNERYIDWARRRFGARASFHAEPYTERHRRELPAFDAVLLMGLLHHLSDGEAHALLALVASSLAPNGRVAALDTVLFDGQSRLSALLARNDRGAFVRSPEGFLALGRAHFGAVDHRIVGDTRRIPSAHMLMVMRRPAPVC